LETYALAGYSSGNRLPAAACDLITETLLMKRSSVVILLAIVGLVALTEGRAFAQIGGMQRPGPIPSPVNPAVSPYTGLLGPSTVPFYQRYFNQVRPELEWRADMQGLQQQVTANNQQIGGLQANQGVLTTGHSTRFLSTGGYFLSGVGRGGARQGR
jgi:hypothetical protein